MPCGAAFAIQSAAEDATGVIKLALTQTQEVLLQEEAEAVLEEHQHLAIRTLAKRLDSADAVDFIGRRHDFHQPLPAGFLAIVINRCAKLCDSDHILCSKGTTIWQRNLITVVSLGGISTRRAPHAAGKLDRRSNCHKARRLCHNTRATSL